MNDVATVLLGSLMATKSSSIDPAKFPSETFDLYSIPAYDSREPEVLPGSAIGSSKQTVESGDVLLSRIVPHIRRAWVVGCGRGRRIIASGEWIVFRSDRFHPDYLRHVLVGDRFHAQFMNTVAGVGGSLLRARPAHVANIRVPLPPLPKQRQIAKILNHADGLRIRRRAAITKLNSLTQSIFCDMFGDPISNQHQWPITKLESVGCLDRGVSKHRPRNAPELLGGPYPLVQTGEIANCDGYVRTHHSTYSDVGLRQSKLWPTGTLCITIAANIAKTGILTFDACFPDSVVGFTADDPATVEYVRIWFSFLQQTLEDTAPEFAQKNINLALLRSLDIPFPPLELQRDFASRLAAATKLRASYSESSTCLDALFASLQLRAFRGSL